jgi:hypothetical protein
MSRARSPRGLLALWLPTGLGATALMAEIPVVIAATARSADGGRALAAVGISLSIIVLINSPALALTELVVTTHERQRPVLPAYALGVGLASAALIGALALAPAGQGLVGAVFSLDEQTLAQVRLALLGLCPASLAVASRRYLHGHLIVSGHTRPITIASLVRIACSGVVAWGLLALVPQAGALSAGCALTVGAYAETAVLLWSVRAWPRLVPPTVADLRGIGVQHAHLSGTRLLNTLPGLVTMVGIAHAAGARDSLVVWPVLSGLLALFIGPLGDLDAIIASRLRSDPADRQPRRFTWWLAAPFVAGFVLVVATPLVDGYIRGFSGVAGAPADLGVGWAPLLIGVPALVLVRAYLRGAIMATGHVSPLSLGVAVHAVALTATMAALPFTALPGVACAALATGAGLLAEVAVLRARQPVRVRRCSAGSRCGRGGSSPGRGTRPDRSDAPRPR